MHTSPELFARAVEGAVGWGSVLAQAGGGVPVEFFLQYGIPGAVIALLVWGPLALGREVTAAIAERDAAIKDRDRYRDSNETIVNSLAKVPETMKAIQDTNEAMMDSVELMVDMIKKLQDAANLSPPPPTVAGEHHGSGS